MYKFIEVIKLIGFWGHNNCARNMQVQDKKSLLIDNQPCNLNLCENEYNEVSGLLPLVLISAGNYSV